MKRFPTIARAAVDGEHWTGAHDVALKRALGEPLPERRQGLVPRKDPNALTDRQRDVLKAIRGYIREHSVAPTYRELCVVLGLNSTRAVFDHLVVLERKGVIRRARNKPRTIVLCDDKAASGDRIIVTREDAKRAILDVLGKFSRGDQVDIVTDVFKGYLKEAG